MPWRRALVVGLYAVFLVGLSWGGIAPAGPFAGIVAISLVGSTTLVVVALCLWTELRVVRSELDQVSPRIGLAKVLPTRLPLPKMTGYAVSPDFALVMVSLIKQHKPKIILETGSGVSTVITGYCIEELGYAGKIISLDHKEQFAAETRNRIKAHGLEQYCTVRHAPLEELTIDGVRHRWYSLSGLEDIGPIDLVIDDGPAPNFWGKFLRSAALPVLAPRIRAGGIYLLDYVGSGERKMVKQWLHSHPMYQITWLDTQKGGFILHCP